MGNCLRLELGIRVQHDQDLMAGGLDASPQSARLALVGLPSQSDTLILGRHAGDDRGGSVSRTIVDDQNLHATRVPGLQKAGKRLADDLFLVVGR